MSTPDRYTLSEWKDLYNKGLIPTQETKLRALAVEYLGDIGWMDDQDAIAKLMVGFYIRMVD
jgi:hypothetical protein|tara:strand:+ start:396 stop:581 length:186 start_codon:yes stop_codon:yes gene_type:complete